MVHMLARMLNTAGQSLLPYSVKLTILNFVTSVLKLDLQLWEAVRLMC